MDALSKENQSANPKILASIESSIKLYIEFVNINYTIIFKNFIYFHSLTIIINRSHSFILFTNLIFIKNFSNKHICLADFTSTNLKINSQKMINQEIISHLLGFNLKN